MSKNLESNIRLDYIRYANCWEDADLLLAGLNPSVGSRILSIASGGDNSFALLSSKPEKILACDFSAVQIHLCELKKAVLTNLSQEEALSFLGVKIQDHRKQVYETLKASMPKASQDYWDEHLDDIQKGILHIGKFERYLTFFRKWILSLIHNRKKRIQLFEMKSAAEQKNFYDQQWNTWRWRLLFKIFFSKAIMGKYGRDPQFLKHVKVSVSEFIFSQAERHLSSATCQRNYFLQYILLGNFDTTLPFYLRKENYDLIRSQISRIEFKQANILDEVKENTSFTHFNLSNIFEYQSEDEFRLSLQALHQCGQSGTRYFFWNLMCPRSMAETAPELFQKNDFKAENDLGFFYLGSRCESRI